VEPLFGRVRTARIDLVATLRTGDLAMTHAEWVLTGTDEDGAEVVMSGRGTVVSRRQPDGTWRVVFDDPVNP
jgi:ketosteroid isomerase-like protein